LVRETGERKNKNLELSLMALFVTSDEGVMDMKTIKEKKGQTLKICFSIDECDVRTLYCITKCGVQ